MDYQKIYTNLIENCKNKEYLEYTEKHHIIPKCMGGTDGPENIVELSAREHFIAHMLLFKIHRTKELAYAMNMMTVHDSSNRSKNRRYSWIRKAFIDNHPTKNLEIRNKISKSLFEYYSSQDYDSKKQVNFWKYREMRLCECGCGEYFICYRKDKKKYVSSKHTPRPDYEQVSKSLKETLSNLTNDQMRDRMKNSLGSCNHEERGKKISASKRGKTTNQQEIVGIRYANMTDEQFEEFLNTKNKNVQKRMLNLRKKYYGRI